MIKVGVYGSAVDEDDSVHKKAFEIGKQIATQQAAIVTGACPGIPFYAVQGAKEHNGYSIGFTAVDSLEKHLDKMKTPINMYDELKVIPDNYAYKDNIDVCFKYRNVASVAAVDVALFISGRWGTLNEFTNAFDMGKIIGVLEGTHGATSHIKLLLQAFKKETESIVIFESDPKLLVSKLLMVLSDKKVRR